MAGACVHGVCRVCVCRDMCVGSVWVCVCRLCIQETCVSRGQGGWAYIFPSNKIHQT